MTRFVIASWPPASQPIEPMSRRPGNNLYSQLTVILLVGVVAGCSLKQREASPVRRIDHIMIRTGQPRELFALFAEVLELPIAWPLATRGGVASGGASFGNVNVEAIQFPDQTGSDTKLVGFGFEPSALDTALAELRRRNIRYGEPRGFYSTMSDGSRRTLWTNVTLLDLSDADRPGNATMHVFLSEYAPAYVNIEQRRERLLRELAASAGGSLGVEAVEEVIIGTTDLQATSKVWERLLGPQRASARGLWHVGDGPAIRLVEASENSLQELVVSVASLQRAEAFLRSRDMFERNEDGIIISSPAIRGVTIRLVQSK
jgi:hypothetical protein